MLDCTESQTSIEENNVSSVLGDEQYTASSSGNEKNDRFESCTDENQYDDLSITDHIRIELMNRPTSAFDTMPSFTVKYMSIPEQSLCSLFSCTHREESPIPMYVSDRGDKLTVSAAEAIYYETNDYDKYESVGGKQNEENSSRWFFIIGRLNMGISNTCFRKQ